MFNLPNDNLRYLADCNLESYLIRQGRIRAAEKRIDLYENHRKHMCLTPGCMLPVIGKRIFIHCGQHLSIGERDWVNDDAEDLGFKRGEAETDPDVAAVQTVLYEKNLANAKKAAKQLQDALEDASRTLRGWREQKRERELFLPRTLLDRLTQFEKSVLPSVDV